MKDDPRILLFCPVSNHKDYILWHWIDYIKKFTYKNLEILLIDNSDNKIYAQRIQAAGIDCINVYAPQIAIREKMFACYKLFRQYFLENKFDYWLSLECDIFPPINVIEHLLALKSRVIGLPYFTFSDSKDQMLFTDFEIGFYENEKQRFQTFFKEFASFNGSVFRQVNTGLGCLLVHRSIIKKIPFRHDPDQEIFQDTVFHNDMFNAGIPAYIDTSVICRHYNSDWNKIKEIDNKKIKSITK